MCKNQEKDYSLLRPLDLEAAKSGAQLCSIYGSIPREFVAGPDANGRVCVAIEGNYNMQRYGDLRMAPLCWVEGRPVYKGDKLWNKFAPAFVYIADKVEGDVLRSNGLTTGNREEVINLTWTPPKEKREGWVNIYPLLGGEQVAYVSHAYVSKKSADRNAAPDRIACIHIEWEE